MIQNNFLQYYFFNNWLLDIKKSAILQISNISFFNRLILFKNYKNIDVKKHTFKLSFLIIFDGESQIQKIYSQIFIHLI